MASSEVIREMREIVSNGNTVPPEVAYRLIISGQIELHDSIEKLIEEMLDTNKRLYDVEVRSKSRECPNLKGLEDDMACVIRRLDLIKDNPSIVWLLRHKTKETAAVIVGVMSVLHTMFIYAGPIIENVLAALL